MSANRFNLISDYRMTGDQPKAVEGLVSGICGGKKYQTLLGATGSGKTFTMANVIERVQKPTLIISHNKTLAAQLCGEFKEFFPGNAVEYFVSYYDYYQPEAYVASTDTYIDKDADINEEIDKLRHSATASISERKDVIIVASVSCIYGLGEPVDYKTQTLSLRPGMGKNRREILTKLVDIQYKRNDMGFDRGDFRVRGDIIDIFPAGGDAPVRVELFGDEIESIKEINYATGEVTGVRSHIAIFPASHYVASPEKMARAVETIEDELEGRLAYFKGQGKLLEAQRLEQRTRYDLEMLREIGTCKGIENYARHISGQAPGSRPYTLIDYFPEDFLVIIDESHVMLPQLRAMYAGDRSRKEALVEYGFRLPSALDNRPLKFEEFRALVGQVVFASATPAEFEREAAGGISAEQVIRPTGLVDPVIEVRPTKGQIDDLIGEINLVTGQNGGQGDGRLCENAAVFASEAKQSIKTSCEPGILGLPRRCAPRNDGLFAQPDGAVLPGGRVLVTVLTKKMAESLTAYLASAGLRVRYMHSDILTFERMRILHDLRTGVFDVLVGINLLREGLDLPEVTRVVILDADKQGFLRNETSLVQTIGRAARNIDGKVIMYADTVSASMQSAIDETNRRRRVQMSYNEAHGITPRTIEKAVREVLEATKVAEAEDVWYEARSKNEMTHKERKEYIGRLEKEMKEAAARLEFERAAVLRDRIMDLKA
ncbi:MAG: excinuclease ABC subunit UvrB [Clostridiales Family XIII bacterium]|jgi:excinuclease ABC subunit B|nr:excinuclease ABC subunit UvrB [Clostridiales Family XIII bacterium]